MTLKELLGDAYNEGMTLEDVDMALAGVNFNKDQQEIDRLKVALSKANSEAAENKRKVREVVANAEAQTTDWQTKYTDLESQLKSIVRENTITKQSAKFVELGYDGQLALKTATAMADGDMETVFNNHRTFIEQHDKAVLADKMRSTPQPSAGGGTGAVTTDYTQLIADAQAAGDYARAAAYMRMQQQQSAQ